MKVFFLPTTAQYVPRLARDFQPGEQEVTDAEGAFLITHKLAVSEAPTFAAPSELVPALQDAQATDEKKRGGLFGKKAD